MESMVSRYTSPHDLPWWSDPDYDMCGNLLVPIKDRREDVDGEPRKETDK